MFIQNSQLMKISEAHVRTLKFVCASGQQAGIASKLDEIHCEISDGSQPALHVALLFLSSVQAGKEEEASSV